MKPAAQVVIFNKNDRKRNKPRNGAKNTTKKT